MSLIYKD